MRYLRNTVLLLTAFLLLICTGCGMVVGGETKDGIISSARGIDENKTTQITSTPDREQASLKPSVQKILSYNEANVLVEDSIMLGEASVRRTNFKLSVGTDIPKKISLDLWYPQLSGIANKVIEEKINVMLLDIAFKSLGDRITISNVEEALSKAQERVEDSPALTDLVAEIDYKILSNSAQYISFYFSGSNTVGANRINKFEYLATIDLQNAGYVNLTSIFDFATIKSSIKEGKFEVISGSYAPGGWDDLDMGASFVEAMNKWTNAEYLQEAHSYSSKRWENGQSVQSIIGQYGTDAVEYSEYDVLCGENFALDKDSVFIQFPFSDSLDGYVVLKIPQIELDGQ